MKRAFAAVVLVVPLLFLTALTVFDFSEVVEANPLPRYKPPEITVSSPSPTETYNVTSIPLMVKVQVHAYTYHSIEHISWLSYSLDGREAIPLTVIYPKSTYPPYFVNGNSTLFQLAKGNHELTIQGETTFNKSFSTTVSFKVDTGPIIVNFNRFIEVTVTVMAIVIVVGACLLVSFKKRKH